MPSAMVWPRAGCVDAAHAGGERGVHRRLDANDADVRLDRLGGRGDAGDQAAAADRHRQDFQVRRVFQHLQGDRALPGHHILVVERVHEHQAAFLLQQQRMLVGRIVAVAFDDHGRAERPGLLDFHERRAARHDDGHRHVQALAMVGEALGVVAGRSRDHSTPLLVGRQLQQFVQRAALLVGGGELQILELHPHLGAGNRRQRPGIAARGALNLSGDAIGRLQDRFIREAHALLGLSAIERGERAVPRPWPTRDPLDPNPRLRYSATQWLAP
jgi:hypothetical protein